MRSRNGATGATLVVAVALIVMGCSGGTTRSPDNVVTPTFGGPATTRAKPTYQPVYEVQAACPVKGAGGIKTVTVVCGTLTVPENRDQPRKNQVKLQVVTLKSLSPTPRADPVVYLEGGPGGSSLASLELWTNPASPLLADRDLILVDQRGTGYSDPRLSCDFEFATATRTDQVAALMGDCYERLSGAKIDLSRYNTAEIAADIADLRRALGVTEWNLLGTSYGTRLALQIMADHPEGVRSVVLDSSYPTGVKVFADIPANANRGLQAVFEACAADRACAARYPNLNDQLSKVIDRLNREPLKVRRVSAGGDLQPFEFTGADFAQFLFQASYIADAIRVIPRTLTLAAGGDVMAGMNLLSGALPTIVANPEKDISNRRPSQSDGLYLSVQCAEDAPLTSATELDEHSTGISEPLRSALVTRAQQGLATCQSWKVPPRTVAETTSDIPTLVLAGSMDPITPPAWGQMAASRLSRSQFVTVDGAGHGVFFSGECPAGLVVSFINDPSAPVGSCPPITGFR